MEDVFHSHFLSIFSLDTLDSTLIVIKRLLTLLGAIVILTGALFAIVRFLAKLLRKRLQKEPLNVDQVRLDLGRSIALGLEFIIAADIIETTTTPDYYSLGILGVLVVIRTFLNFFLNKELNTLSRQGKIKEQSL